MNDKIKKIIFIITMFLLTNNNVFAVTNTYISEMKDSNGQKIYRNFNGKQERQLSIEIGEHSSNTTTAYCIDVGLDLGDRAPISELDDNLTEYLTKALNDSKKAQDVSKKINQYIRFGYKYNNQNTDKYLIATQKLIWDELYNAGYRKEYYSNNVNFTAGDNTYDISSEEKIIKNNINNYYKTPSMCSNKTNLEIAVGETKTYEDTENVLPNYKVNCDDGLTCEIEGNKLIITANKESSNHQIKFTKEGINGKNNIIYQRSGEQAVIINAESIEGVSCEFGIDSYQKEEENVTENAPTAGSKVTITMIIGMLSLTIAYIITRKISI